MLIELHGSMRTMSALEYTVRYNTYLTTLTRAHVDYVHRCCITASEHDSALHIMLMYLWIHDIGYKI